MRLSQVWASLPGLRRETFPFELPLMAQQVQVNRTLYWGSHGQIKLSWMLIYMSIVHYLVVHSLSVLAGRGKHTRSLSEMGGGITKTQNRSLKMALFNINGILSPVKRGKVLSKLKKDKIQIAFLQESRLSDSEHTKLNRFRF